MTIALAVLLGIIQGLTEFFPVSSSGHLALFGNWFGLGEPDLTFDVLVHIATLAAILVYFRKDWFQLIELFWQQLRARSFTVPSNSDLPPLIVPFIIVSMIPAGLVGVFLKDQIASLHQSNPIVGGLMLVTAVILLLGFRFNENEITLKQMGWTLVVTISLAQAVAILPGISRSGATIMAALFLGMRRPDAARFSFLMAVPVIGGAGVLALKDLLGHMDTMSSQLLSAYALGFLAALFSGFIALKWMMALLEGKRYFYFGYYCLAMGLAAIIAG